MRALRDFLLAPPPGGAALEERPGPLDGRSSVRRGRRAAASRDRVAAHLAAASRADERTAPGAVAVLCAAEDAQALAVATAAHLARRSRAACALACVWASPEPERRADAGPRAARAARRLAAALTARGLDTRACGRVAAVALPSDPDAASSAYARAAAAAGDAPTVLVLGGPRPAAVDDLLTGRDLVIVAARPGAEVIAALALEGLPVPGARAAVHALSLGPATRTLAARGLVVPAALRTALDAPRRDEAP